MKILSFDCANRSLAVCCVNLQEKIKLNMIKVIDVTKQDKVDTIQRTHLLKQCLVNIDKEIGDVKPDIVLVEYQMSANDKSRCVSNQIVYHYSCLEGTNVHLVGPTLKNKVCLSDDDSLKHSTFMSKYSSKYTANKNHSKANFLHWIDSNNNRNYIKEIKKKNLDDAADAFMQILGWLEFKR